MPQAADRRRWSIEIYHVLDHDRQQRILEVFRDIGRHDFTVLGTQRGRDWFVVVETSSADDRYFVQRTIGVLDLHAVRAYSSKASSSFGRSRV